MTFRPLENLGLKLFALLVALVLWALVMGEQGVERVVNARVEFQDMPSDLVLLSRSDRTLRLRLRGPRRLLASLEMDEVAVSLAGRPLKEGATTVPLAPGDILGVSRGLEVVEVSPRSLRVEAEAMVRRDVQVMARIEGTPGRGFVVRQVRLEPEAVQIAGPRSEVRKVLQAYTLPVSVEGRTEAFSARAALEPIGRAVQFVNEGPIRVNIDIGPPERRESRGAVAPRGPSRGSAGEIARSLATG